MSGMDEEGDETRAGWTRRESRHERDGRGGRRDISGMDGEGDETWAGWTGRETKHERYGRGA